MLPRPGEMALLVESLLYKIRSLDLERPHKKPGPALGAEDGWRQDSLSTLDGKSCQTGEFQVHWQALSPK